jgi:hypothetical protein
MVEKGIFGGRFGGIFRGRDMKRDTLIAAIPRY